MRPRRASCSMSAAATEMLSDSTMPTWERQGRRSSDRPKAWNFAEASSSLWTQTSGQCLVGGQQSCRAVGRSRHRAKGAQSRQIIFTVKIRTQCTMGMTAH